MRRSEAADLIDKIRQALLHPDAVERIKCQLELRGIPPLLPCDGDAHSNLYIDKCGWCAPRWGAVGPRVIIR